MSTPAVTAPVDRVPSPARAVPSVLVVDDDSAFPEMLATNLSVQGFEVLPAPDGQTALDRVRAEPPSVVILDLRMPGLDGLETLSRIRVIAPQVPVIMLSAYGDIASVVTAMRLGAHDFLTKPARSETIIMAIRRALEHYGLGAELEEVRTTIREHTPLRWLMGPSDEIKRVVQHVGQVAASILSIVIEGETGTGKELVARAIHQMSDRRDKPFVALDCGAIPETLIQAELFGYEKGAFTGADRRKEGRLQAADEGSLFFDEVANLLPATQRRLLRVLQEREVQMLGGPRPVPIDVRIIAASNVPLTEAVRAGRFRPDLYYRLAEFVIVVPPLRERQEDILYLAQRFLAEARIELGRPVHGISEEATEMLLRYPWPGNVRELRNVIRRAVVLSPDVIRPDHLVTQPSGASGSLLGAGAGPMPTPRSLKEIVVRAASGAERQAIRQALEAARGNKSEAARTLRIDYKTLDRKMKRYGILAREFRAS